MKNKFATAGFLTFALLFIGARQVTSAQTREPEFHRWEYCAVTDSFGTGTKEKVYGIAVLTFFEADGDRSEYIRVDLDPSKDPPNRYDLAQKRAFAKAVAKLGNDGWELVGSAPSPYLKLSNPTSPEGDAIFFKRPKHP